MSLTLNHAQKNILDFLNHVSGKTIGIEAPTGAGKTVAYLAYAIQIPLKVVISTFTKALQEQVVKDLIKFFPRTNYIVLKGKNNYSCMDKVSILSSEEQTMLLSTRPPLKILDKIKVTSEYCRPAYQCQYREHCQYMKDLRAAKDSETKIVIINHFLLRSFLRKITEPFVLIIDECHQIKNILKERIYISQEAFEELPPEPSPAAFNTVQEYNLACESYLKLKNQVELSLKYNIKEPGFYEFDIDLSEELSLPERVIYTSATFPYDLEVEDFYSIKDQRHWEDVTITVKNIHYKDMNYFKTLKDTIKDALKTHEKVMVLATNYETVDWIKENFPEALTTKDTRTIELAEKLKKGEVKLIAGCDTLWTGIDVPGEKCIIMTKLPFPVLEKTKEFESMRAQMLVRFKQGVGRMLRSSYCKGQIIILDSRVKNYPEVIQYLKELESLGAKVTIESAHASVVNIQSFAEQKQVAVSSI